MERLIARLDRWLKEQRPAYYAELQPGLSGVRLREFERAVGFPVPDGFKALYAWKNGQAPTCFAALQFNRMFMNIEEVLGRHSLLTEMRQGGEFDQEMWWSPGWVPFLENHGGDLLCLDVDGAFTGVGARSSVSGTTGGTGISSSPAWRSGWRPS